MKYYKNGVMVEMPVEMEQEINEELRQANDLSPVTIESLDHRLSDVEYIITGEVATDAQ